MNTTTILREDPNARNESSGKENLLRRGPKYSLKKRLVQM